MKYVLSLLAVLFVLGVQAGPGNPPASAEETVTFRFDPAAFEASYKKFMEEARVRFKNIKTGDPSATDNPKVKEYAVTELISQAHQAKLLVDDEKYHMYVAEYPEMPELAQAGKLFNQILDIAEKAAPEGFKFKQADADGYINNMRAEIQLDTEDFSALGRQPAFKMGIVKREFAYIVEVTVTAPWW